MGVLYLAEGVRPPSMHVKVLANDPAMTERKHLAKKSPN